MAKRPREVIRYSISFKQKVVREIEEEGLSYGEAARRYGIKGSPTVHRWVCKFGKNHLLGKVIRVEMKGEKDRLKELEAELKKVKIALADATMKNDLLETMIEMVNEHYHTDVKKNLGQGLSKGASNKKGTK